MILTLAPIFFDNRFYDLRTKEHEELVAKLAHLCTRSISKPDAGLWEIRDGWKEHSFTNLMCWAGLDRAERMQRAGFLRSLSVDLDGARTLAVQALEGATKGGALRNGPNDDTYDAALAQAAILGFPNRKICEATTGEILRELVADNGGEEIGFFYRYLRPDDFGTPQAPFVICSFWVVQALVKLGRLSEAQQVMSRVMIAANSVGLLSEHFLPHARLQLGNFPQAYSHVGLINAAFALSPPWSEML
jgi:GH15 family glucan-1,4-alpha-glucosidase